ncbi:2-hydroxyglutaryl-CoA dehydratase D-component, partial [Striga asiatica]
PIRRRRRPGTLGGRSRARLRVLGCRRRWRLFAREQMAVNHHLLDLNSQIFGAVPKAGGRDSWATAVRVYASAGGFVIEKRRRRPRGVTAWRWVGRGLAAAQRLSRVVRGQGGHANSGAARRRLAGESIGLVLFSEVVMTGGECRRGCSKGLRG